MYKAIIGVAGAGKTTKLVELYKNNNWDVHWDTIVTSLTNASIRAFLTKINLKYKTGGARTIYGLAYMSLKEHDLLDSEKEKMLSDKYQYKYLNELRKKFRISTKKLEIMNNIFLKSILMYKNPGHFDEFVEDIKLEKINKKALYKIYNDYLNNKYYNYSFLLYEAIKNKLDIFKVYSMDIKGEITLNRDPDRIIIDEFQDFPFLFTKQVLNKGIDIYFAGDPAQEIFSFAVPDVDYVLSIVKDQEFLVKTHRFGKNISNIANKFLTALGFNYKIITDNTTDLYEKYYFNTDTFISILKTLYSHELIKDIAILTRTRDQIKEIEQFLLKYKIPFINLEKYELEKITDILTIIQEMEKSESDIKKEIYSGVLSYFKKNTDVLIDYLKRLGYGHEYIDLAKRLLTEKKRIYISTIHNVKGLEFDAVLIYNKSSSLIDKVLKRHKGLEQELKVAYTSVTRAKKVCIIFDTEDVWMTFPPI